MTRVEVFSLAARKGLIIVHTGSGKGKTTAALRAAGQGLKVLMVQFIKGSWHYGELDAAKMLGNDPIFMTWFSKQKQPLETPKEKRVQTEGLWVKCEKCKQILWKKDLEANLQCCPKCGFHFKLSARARLETLFDDGRYTEHDARLSSTDPLQFKDTKSYRDRLENAEKATGMKDALLTGEGLMEGKPAIVCAMEFQCVGGSMGAVVGEKVTRAIDRCIEQGLPLVIISCSAGARMMEGAISLMQMTKICAALARLDEVRKPYISVLTDPTTGGVTASYAMLGD